MVLAVKVLALIATASSPPMECEISMTNWCIVRLSSSIEMRETGSTREWKIRTNRDVAEAEISIVEDKFCGGALSYKAERSLVHDTFVILSNIKNCGLRVSVSRYGSGVNPKSLAGMAIMLRSGRDWKVVRF